ncbi:hypothetical protein QJS10_CPA10g00593 [Acorus calamus]|uniref:Alpha-amylase n=1 Tax=Acorus calamus TaxID=4465 RepID=A0AAV9DX15_ACOCL|nr:hypothetical protein QJS10_CPA10g00593 [Acorus calamus]
MATTRLNPLLHLSQRIETLPRLGFLHPNRKLKLPRSKPSLAIRPIRAKSTDASPIESATPAVDAGVSYSETFRLKHTRTLEGKVSVRLDRVKEGGGEGWRLVVGCNLEGKWVLHWGVTYSDEFGSEWDQPPPDMRPPGSIPIKDYAIETPMTNSSSPSGEQTYHNVQIDIHNNSSISAVHFVLKEEETGGWYQHRGRDFRVPLMDCLHEEENDEDEKKGFSIWPGAFDKFSNILLKTDGSHPKSKDNVGGANNAKQQNGFYEEYPILKEEPVQSFMTVSVKESDEEGKNLVGFDTDLPGEVVIHWGVCKDYNKMWEIPPPPHPPGTKIFRNKALRTSLQPKENGQGSWGLFAVEKKFSGLPFVLKHNHYTWLYNMGTDFYIPLPVGSFPTQFSRDKKKKDEQTMTDVQKQGVMYPPKVEDSQSASDVAETEDIINGIRNLVTDISSEKGPMTKSKEAQENILLELEKLAAEAYSIFRSSPPTFDEEAVSEAESLKPFVELCSGTGSGYEIVFQGFNWESNKSGRWYSELNEKISEIASLGFTIVWLPPPTESVSPEGYMPKDLYNLNSRYGTMDQLKLLVKRFHEEGIRVLGDAVLNHRCAHYQNKNGVWNIFGGRLNWDDRAVVADDPHFQGRGNKSSGDNFHAAPNIDHSQDFVRKDLKEWLCWLRKEIGYDGWRLDFVRGFWGGYVKDYLEASEPYFAVGEFWDSLSYTYGAMDYNQDAHRQRIIDWLNAVNGKSGAFDVTTKGILHAVLEKCEYWRLSDAKGKPPGVVGWWPSRAVTFIENHDTGSTQGHWRFPAGKEMQGYAYILTHPGTPAVFYDHVFSHYQQEISSLISLRNRNKIHCRSTIRIVKAEREVYAAEIDEKVMMKIGPGHFEPPSGPQRWQLATEGRDYKVWEAL